MLIKFDVTQEVIDESKKLPSLPHIRIQNCPVVLTLQRKLNDPEIRSGRIFFRIKNEVYTYPERVSSVIEKFDETEIMEPFLFELDIKL